MFPDISNLSVFGLSNAFEIAQLDYQRISSAMTLPPDLVEAQSIAERAVGWAIVGKVPVATAALLVRAVRDKLAPYAAAAGVELAS